MSPVKELDIRKKKRKRERLKVHDSLQEITRQQLWMHLVINATFPQNKRNAGVNEIEKQHLGENSPKVILWKSSFLERERQSQ